MDHPYSKQYLAMPEYASTRSDRFLIVTSISAPTDCMRALAAAAVENGFRFLCIGDLASPQNYDLPGCEFLGIRDQVETGLAYAAVAPTKHYARKNIGYLVAAQRGAGVMLETDDDNAPQNGFWDSPSDTLVNRRVRKFAESGWSNVYGAFGSSAWPRGYPLQSIGREQAACVPVAVDPEKILVKQGLVSGDPDVDAIFRLTQKTLPDFDDADPVWFGRHAWTPFNSQNTWWHRLALPLMYLPATCSFRATDIIRGYVALRCLWELDSGVLYTGVTAHQIRNEHDLMKDFEQEIELYTNTRALVETLEALPLATGPEKLVQNMRSAYRTLVEFGAVSERELSLLDAWLQDVVSLS